MKIIGFEGGIRLDTLTVTYGAAAIQHGDTLINAAQRATYITPMSEWLDLVIEGHVVELPEPIDLPHELYDAPCYVMIANVEFAGLLLHFAQQKAFCDACWNFSPWPDTIGFIFPTFEELNNVARATADYIQNTILITIDDVDKQTKERWATASRILDPWDGLGQEEWVRQFSERIKKRREGDK